MSLRYVVFCIALCTSLNAPAQAAVESAEKPEEIIVTGQRNVLRLRQMMMDAEQQAYGLFNQFNDEKRFDISCSKQQGTGRFIANQLCQPEFVIQATRVHAKAYLQSMGDIWDIKGGLPDGIGAAPVGAPMAATISSQQADYRRKMQQVAEEHPEFLEALIRYSEITAEYEEARGMGDK